MDSSNDKKKKSFTSFVVKNILIAIVALFVLAWLALFLVDFYTRHGDTEIMPDVRGMYLEEAQNTLEKHNLTVKIVDSMYIAGKPLGLVIEQTPAAGSTVKPYRDIYLVINSKQMRQIPLPDIIENSYRQADATLNSIGLKVGNVEYQASEYKDLVLAVKYRGNVIVAGTRVPDGSAVTLVVGMGLGVANVAVPAVKGLTLEQARETLLNAGFVIGAVDYDKQPDGNEADYVIYRQKPMAGVFAVQGTNVDIWLSTDKSLLNKTFDENDAEKEKGEEFF